ncbi:Calx-beta domain-containing protein [Caenibius sp. WL]|uniref:beta strand repeat-containing protein n=1 Tax=Caenibius sp. WL TaxID=2872646 RepID=UPI001C99588C|nr:Calx-beta domain-containing protein [Caenibius sp. WL]QZP09152.1 hypothetical protein K5X80_05125 [Caenibius sp. WL]
MKRTRRASLAFFLASTVLAGPAYAGTVTYTYDALGRLVRSVSNGTSTADSTYTLDPAGNRTNVTVTGSPIPSFSIDSVSVTEGGTATLTVTKSGAASGTLSVNYASADGTATAGSDYTATGTQTLTFLAAENSKTITIPTIDDAVIESAESFTVTLSGNSAGSVIAQATGTVTINDNDATSFAISDAPAVTEGGNLVYTVTKTGGVAANVTYASADGTATAGADYTATGTQTLTFLAADTTKTITVPTIDDSAIESAETVLVNLSGATNGATISRAQGSGTINDNDAPPVSFAIADASVTEGGNVVFTVTRSGDTSGAVTVAYASSDGTATAGSDYTAVSGTLSFAANETSKTITVATTADTTIESDETFTMTLSNPSTGSITTATATGTIINDDVAPANLAIDSVSATEGGSLVFTVTRSGNTATAVSVNYASASGTATSGADFTAVSGTLNFAANETTKIITVATTDDTSVEGTEMFTVTLSGASANATITTASGTGTINDNDVASVNFSIANAASVEEGNSATFTVTKTGSASGTTTVQYTTASGTATSGSDFTPTSGTLSFSRYQTSKTITVPTIDDAAQESTENFTVVLSNPSTGTGITNSTATGTITDNDSEPRLKINSASATEGSPIVFTVTRSGLTTTAVSVNYATSSGTAASGTDFTAASGTLNFAANETSKTISVSTVNDSLTESNETFNVTLSGATGGAIISTATGTGTIIDNDQAWTANLTVGSTSCSSQFCSISRGYSQTSAIGSLSNTTFGAYTITAISQTVSSGSPTGPYLTTLQMTGSTSPPNSGWSTITIPGIGTLNRSGASYSGGSGTGASWMWYSVPGAIASGAVIIQ